MWKKLSLVSIAFSLLSCGNNGQSKETITTDIVSTIIESSTSIKTELSSNIDSSSEKVVESTFVEDSSIEITTYSVLFIIDDLTIIVYVNEAETVVPPQISKKGYDFLGWYTIDDELFDLSIPIASDLQLYSKWELQFGPIV